MSMQAPIHAGEDVGKEETVPRLIAAAVGVAIIAAVAGIIAWSGLWSPPPTSQQQPAHTEQAG